MAIYRENGGVFAPVTALSINDGGVFKNIAEAWVNDGGTFKKVFSAGPTNAENSPLYDTDSAVGSMAWMAYVSSEYLVGFTSNRYNGSTPSSARIPLVGSETPAIQGSVFRLRDASGNIIPTAGGAAINGNPSNPSAATLNLYNILDERTGVLRYSIVNNVTYLTCVDSTSAQNGNGAPTISSRDYPVGTVVQMEWEWKINGQWYFFKFPSYTLTGAS